MRSKARTLICRINNKKITSNMSIIQKIIFSFQYLISPFWESSMIPRGLGTSHQWRRHSQFEVRKHSRFRLLILKEGVFSPFNCRNWSSLAHLTKTTTLPIRWIGTETDKTQFLNSDLQRAIWREEKLYFLKNYLYVYIADTYT